jgi:shikimate kinase/3-dehydroquinate synthase
MNKILYIIGFSGTGKSAASKLAAEALGWKLFDMDQIIEEEIGKPISQIFEQNGEEWFRDKESELLLKLSKENNCIISTGGGLPVKGSNFDIMNNSGYVLTLDASIDIIVKRLKNKSSEGENEKSLRPKLIQSSLSEITQFKSERSDIYAKSDFTINTNKLSVEEVANNIVYQAEKYVDQLNSLHFEQFDSFCTNVLSKNNQYGVFVGLDIYKYLPEVMNKIINKQKVYLLSDDGSKPYMRKIQQVFELAGKSTTTFVIPQGETSKSLSISSKIYEWLSYEHADRGDVLIGVGGGVVGDITGFVASTYMRGIKFVLVPTTLLSMSDSSIGGKTAVDVNKIKNLVGSFYNPSLVYSDLISLKTLPERQINSGWAELIKHGFIKDRDLLDQMIQIQDYKKINDNVSSIIKKSIQIKGEIVTVDENEKYGSRIMLNYGHTLGHAIESSTNLEQYTHGEAVSIGMSFAAKLSNHLNMLSDDDLKLHNDILKKFDLPVSPDNIDWEKCFELIKNDKKVKNGKINWILLESLGKAVVRDNIDKDTIFRIFGEM